MATISLEQHQITIKGNIPHVGDKAPDFHVVTDNFDEVHLSDFKDQLFLLNTYPSIETKVCHESAICCLKYQKLFPNLMVLNVSMDLPYAIKSYNKSLGNDHVLNTSDYRNRELGDAYGVTMLDGPLAGLLARGVFLIDENQVVKFAEIMDDLSDQPDLDKIKAVLEQR